MVMKLRVGRMARANEPSMDSLKCLGLGDLYHLASLRRGGLDSAELRRVPALAFGVPHCRVTILIQRGLERAVSSTFETTSRGPSHSLARVGNVESRAMSKTLDDSRDVKKVDA